MTLETLKIGTAAVCAALALTGCGAFERAKDKAEKANKTDFDLAGEWAGPCLDAGLFGFTQTSETYAFDGVGAFEKTTRTFTDRCASEAAEVHVKGTAAVLGDSAAISGAKEVNFTITEATLTPKSEDTVRELTRASYCGVTDWSLNQPVDLIGRDCAGESYDKGEVVFDVYRRDGDRLVLGRSGLIWFDKSEASERPTELDQQRVFQKR